MTFNRSPRVPIAVVVTAFVVAACSPSSPFDSSRRVSGNSQPQNLTPVQDSSVQSSSLPPLQGQDGQVTTSDDFNPNAEMEQGENGAMAGTTSGTGTPGQTASADGSFTTLDGTGSTTTPEGRTLSRPLSATQLLGAWTVNADMNTCRVNLTQTTKTGTNRYRASAPNCSIPAVSLVSSWQLNGNQVQLYDESGTIIGAFQLSGNRFVGTLSGGQSATMEG